MTRVAAGFQTKQAGKKNTASVSRKKRNIIGLVGPDSPTFLFSEDGPPGKKAQHVFCASTAHLVRKAFFFL
jgi:hypothetical protein